MAADNVTYDVAKLKSISSCRTVMERARPRNLPEVYNAVFRRMCQLVGSQNDGPTDPLVRNFFETLAAYEQLLTEKNGRSQLAHRTRQKISNKGVHQSLIKWTRGKAVTEGFKLLVGAGLPEFTDEYLVVRARSASKARNCDAMMAISIEVADAIA